MIRNEPFKRAKEMAANIAGIMREAAADLILRKMLLSAMPEYKSRGHGRRARTMCRTNFERPAHNAPKQVQGKREIARRLRQAVRG